MKALLVYGSKHGSTKRIAEEISTVLMNEGFETRIVDAKESIQDVERFDLVVVGSALYLGSWLKGPINFLRENQAVLKTRPVWLFSSGLRSEDPRSTNPKIISELSGAIGPCDHQFFSGSLDPKELGWLHRVLLRLPGIRSRFPVGDYRDWNEIQDWTREVARTFRHSRFEKKERIQSGCSGMGATSPTDRGHTIVG